MSDFLSPVINDRLEEKRMEFREKLRAIVTRNGNSHRIPELLEDELDKLTALFLDTIEKAKPEEIDDGDGWDIYFSNGNDDDGKARNCCPGDDIAYVHNKVIDGFTAALKKEIGK